jgi:hypothetical protein
MSVSTLGKGYNEGKCESWQIRLDAVSPQIWMYSTGALDTSIPVLHTP